MKISKGHKKRLWERLAQQAMLEPDPKKALEIYNEVREAAIKAGAMGYQVVCSGTQSCGNRCTHGTSHMKEECWGGDDKWCTEWGKCDIVNKKVRCTKVKGA